MRARGLIQRTPGTFPEFRSIRGIPINGKADLFSHVPGIFDQGPVGSCEAHRTAGAIYTTLSAKGNPLPFVPSMDQLYRLGRAIDRRAYGERGPLTDSGVTTHSMLQAISCWGVVPMGPDVEGRHSDCARATVADEPDFLGIVQSSEVLIAGAYEITSRGDQRVTDVCHALDAGYAVGLDVFVDTHGPCSFENWDPYHGPLSDPVKTDPNGGGHAVYAIGYQFDGPKFIINFVNSWGEEWGLRGIGQGNRNFLDAALGVCVFDVRRQS